MKTIVITGSTRGIGFAFACEFLKQDCQIVISGRSDESVKNSVAKLEAEYSKEQIAGFACDVTQFSEISALWRLSKTKFGKIDIWINNAGISNEQASCWEIPVDEIRSVVETNILGEIFGTKVAIQGFLDQGFGAIYNVEGLGANGKTNNVKGLSIYGMSKAGLHYFNQCLFKEIDHPQIIAGALQPGMVLTDLVKGQYEEKPEEWEKVKGILEIIASPIDEVATWMANKILTNHKNGAYFHYGGTLRILKRMILSPFRKKTRNQKIR
jgi:NAD(P)-dependent dehydrogenase (short-subunit alcohol dehydrogenase family)